MLCKHVEDGSLELYAKKRLQEEETERVEEHLLVCEGCRVRLVETERYIAGFRLAARRIRQEQASRRLRPLWQRFWESVKPHRSLAAIAASASLAVVLVIGRHNSQKPVSYLDVTLRTTRGPESSLAVATGRVHYRLHLDATGLAIGSNSVVIVADSSGREVRRESGIRAGESEVVATVGTQLKPGTYWVRLAAAASAEPLREYQLDVE